MVFHRDVNPLIYFSAGKISIFRLGVYLVFYRTTKFNTFSPSICECTCYFCIIVIRISIWSYDENEVNIKLQNAILERNPFETSNDQMSDAQKVKLQIWKNETPISTSIMKVTDYYYYLQKYIIFKQISHLQNLRFWYQKHLYKN